MRITKQSAFFLLLCLVMACFGVPQQTPKDLVMTRTTEPAGLPVYTGSHALIVGINKYSNLDKKVQLKYAVNDAEEMRKTLIDFYGFPPANVTMLTDSQATLQNIESALDKLSDRANVRADDRIVIYFSGHGQTVRGADGSDRGFLIPSDAKVNLDSPNDIAPYENTCLPMQEVWNRLDPSPAKHIAVIADACFSGLLTRPRSLDEENPLAAYLTMPARQAIAAGGRGQKTWETDQYKHGVFTYNLLNELKKRAKEKQRVFSMLDLFASIQDPVVKMSGGRQVPQINQFFTEGQMLFFAAGDKPVTDDPKVDNPPKTQVAKLVVKSSPEGARVTVDGEEIGEAPLTKEYELEKNKKVKVRLDLEGYEPREKTVELKPKKEAKVDEKLKKLKEPPKLKPATLTVVSSPAGATVSVDGQEVGATPLERKIELTGDKSVSVKLALEGYENAERTADLKAGRETKLNITLVRLPEKPKKATLVVETEPKGAEISIDGIVHGKSPVTYSQEILAPVSVSVKASLTGYETAEQTATLDPNVPASLKLTLKKRGTTIPPTAAAVRLSKRATFAYTGPVRTIQYSPDGSKVAITGTDNTITFFNTATGAQIREIKEPVNAYVRLSSDWQSVNYIYLYTNGGRAYCSVMVQDIDNPKSAKVYSASMGNSTALNYAMSSSGSLIICGQAPDGSASMSVLDLLTGKSDSFQIGGRLQGAWVSPDGNSIAVFRDAISSTMDSNVVLLRGRTRDDQQQVRIDGNVGQKIIYAQSSDAIAVNAGRRAGGTAQTQRGFQVIETRDGRLRFSSTRHVALGFMAGGTRLLAWSEAQGGSLELFDAVSGQSLGSQKSAKPFVSENGKFLLLPVPGGLELHTIEPVK